MTEVLQNTLYVTTPGTSLHLEGDAVRIYHPDTDPRRLPLIRIDHVVAFGGVTVTDDLLHRCAADQRSVTWLSSAGRFRARVDGAQAGNPLLRVAQHDHLRDTQCRQRLAASFVAGKLHNARQLLLRAAEDAGSAQQTRLRDTADQHAQSLQQLAGAASIDTILGVEGMAARRYVEAWPDLVKSQAEIAAPSHRTSRPPTDPVNSALSFGYALLRIAVHGALGHVGLDPYIGYLHGIRPGKPSLALDLMEEFRALLVDRLVFTALNRRQLRAEHFTRRPGGAYEFTEDGRRTFLGLWSEARARQWPHPTLGRKIPAATLPLVQARLLARYLRGDLDAYPSWSPT